jgi:hypothetical protein
VATCQIGFSGAPSRSWQRKSRVESGAELNRGNAQSRTALTVKREPVNGNKAEQRNSLANKDNDDGWLGFYGILLMLLVLLPMLFGTPNAQVHRKNCRSAA